VKTLAARPSAHQGLWSYVCHLRVTSKPASERGLGPCLCRAPGPALERIAGVLERASRAQPAGASVSAGEGSKHEEGDALALEVEGEAVSGSVDLALLHRGAPVGRVDQLSHELIGLVI
jgi:hypothetical protein